MIKSFIKDGISYLYKVEEGTVRLMEVHAGADYIPASMLDRGKIEQMLSDVENGQVGEKQFKDEKNEYNQLF
jgi:hypothetical protein